MSDNNFAENILDLIVEQFGLDKEFLIKNLKYLYETSEDEMMKEKIVEYFNKMEYCIDCCSELKLKTNENSESFYYCPNCDDVE